MHSLYVAWQYLRFHKVKAAVLIAALTLVIYLPLAVHILVRASEVQMLDRSQATPLILGQKGSALDLVMNTLYFASKPPEPIPMGEADRIDETGFAFAIPIYNRYTARGFPIVGTTLDYVSFRGLEVASGRMLAVLGECVLGAAVADRLGLGPGDALISTPENPFDLAGVYPLKMQVVGVLKARHTPDDRAVFVDVRTAWVIEGLGHGHEGRGDDPRSASRAERRGRQARRQRPDRAVHRNHAGQHGFVSLSRRHRPIPAHLGHCRAARRQIGHPAYGPLSSRDQRVPVDPAARRGAGAAAEHPSRFSGCSTSFSPSSAWPCS